MNVNCHRSVNGGDTNVIYEAERCSGTFKIMYDKTSLEDIQISSVYGISFIPGGLNFIQNRFISACHLRHQIFVIILNIHMVNAVVGDEQLRLRFFRNLS